MLFNKEKIIELSDGNPGAAVFLMAIFNHMLGEIIFEKIEKLPSLRGTNLHVLWSDICDKDMFKVYLLLIECPSDILEDACSRQDRSGIALVKAYLKSK
jgi:hypothetical protein